MAKCIRCGSITKKNEDLCSTCNDDELQKKSSNEIVSKNEFNLSNRQKNYSFNMIKGRIAETLIQELFLCCGYKVFRYGMENTIPGIMEYLQGAKTDIAKSIRFTPDFVVLNPNTKDIYYVEVKFRADGEFVKSDVGKDNRNMDTFIVLVSKTQIKCLTVQELQNGEKITPNSENYLENRKEFNLEKEVVNDFCKFAELFFNKV